MGEETIPSETGDSELFGEGRGFRTPIVGLGGSAGSIEPLQIFFRAVPEASGMAYVVILHLSAAHESSLSEILQRCTRMPVIQVSDTTEVAADHVYVIPPGKHLEMEDGCIRLTDADRPRGQQIAVDRFFRTLADTHGPLAVAVVLSGIDGDGALGLKRIKERGGLGIAQDPEEAQEKGMPESAIATGVVDWVLKVAEMPARLVAYHRSGQRLALPPEDDEGDKVEFSGSADGNEKLLREVLTFLKARTGRDFSYYKRATILRRLGRRMQINECSNIGEYLDHLRTHAWEASALLQDLLISVTNFFRDREAFAALEEALPKLLGGKQSGQEVRVWVPACATGEEAYSIAILLNEVTLKLGISLKILIFATDIDRSAIEFARQGRYPEAITADISEERLAVCFVKEGKAFQIKRNIREMVLFALHDLLPDPPFSRLDLICCRNLLIYLNKDAQERATTTFHFSLRPGGLLFLGQSETVDDLSNLFSPLDKKHRIYTRCDGPKGLLAVSRDGLRISSASELIRGTGQTMAPRDPGQGSRVSAAPDRPPGDSLEGLHFRLANRHMPASVIVNRSQEVIHLSDRAGELLQPGGGSPSVNLIHLVQPELRLELRNALFRAEKSEASVETQRVPVQLRNGSAEVRMEVHPGAGASADLFLVVFHIYERDGEAPAPRLQTPTGAEAAIRSLEEQLDQVRARWKESTEQHEIASEELQASNEELQATNEEMHAAAEELETGREELQSMNEELSTVNTELKEKVEELSHSNSDLNNLMAATNIATIFLDKDLRIHRYTPSAVGLFNLIESDLGRPLGDLTHHLVYPSLAVDARRVFDELRPLSREVRTDGGGWNLARMLPYRSMEGRIDGVVLTFMDITMQKEDDEARRWLSANVESSNDAIISFTLDGEILGWNTGATRIFGYSEGEMKGRIHEILAPPQPGEDNPDILAMLRRGEAIGAMESVRQRKDGKLIEVSFSASVMFSGAGEVMGATAIIQDITSRKKAIQDLQAARAEIDEKVDERTHELREGSSQLKRMAIEVTRAEQRERLRMSRLLHDHVQQLVVSAKMHLESLRRSKARIAPGDISQSIAILEDVLESSRSLAVDLSPPVLSEGLAVSLQWLADWVKLKHDLDVRTKLDPEMDADGSEARSLVFLAIRELLFNVVKHTDMKEAFLTMEASGNDRLKVMVRDHGLGFDPESLKAANPGTSGLGLFSLRGRLAMIGGTLEFVSAHGKGVEAAIIVPRAPSRIKQP